MANEYRIVYCIEPLEGNSNNSLAETLSFLDLDEKGVLLYIKTKHGEILQIKDEKVNVLEKINDAFIQVGLSGDTTIKLSMMFVTRPEGATDGWNIAIPNLNISELMAGINPADFNLYVNNDKHGNALVNFVDPQSVWFDDESGETKVNLKTRLDIATGLYKSKLLQCFKHFRRIMEHEIYSMCSVLKVPSALATYMYDVASSVIEIIEVSNSVSLFENVNLEEIIRDLDPIEKGPGFITVDLTGRDSKKFYNLKFTHEGMGEIHNKHIPPVVFPLTVYVANSNSLQDVDVATAVVSREGYVLNFSKHGHNPDGSFSNINLIGVSKSNNIMVRGETKVHIRFSSVYRINPVFEEVVYDNNSNGSGLPLHKFRNAEFVGGMSYHAHTMLVGDKGSPYLLNTGFIQETSGGPSSFNMFRGPLVNNDNSLALPNFSSYYASGLRKLGEVARNINLRPMLSRPYTEIVKPRNVGHTPQLYMGFNTLEYAGGAHYGAVLTTLGITKLTRGFDYSLHKQSGNYQNINSGLGFYNTRPHNVNNTTKGMPFSYSGNAGDFKGVPLAHHNKPGNKYDFVADGREIPNTFDYSYKMLYVAEDFPDLYVGFEKDWYDAGERAPIKTKDLFLSNKTALSKKNWYNNFPMHIDYVSKFAMTYDLSDVSFKPKQYVPVSGGYSYDNTLAIFAGKAGDIGDNSWYSIIRRLKFKNYNANISIYLKDNLDYDFERVLRKNITESIRKYRIFRINSQFPYTLIDEDRTRYGGYAFGFFGNLPPWGYGRCQANTLLSIRNYPSFFIDPEFVDLSINTSIEGPGIHDWFAYKDSGKVSNEFREKHFFSYRSYKFLNQDENNVPLMPNYMTISDARTIKPYEVGTHDATATGFLPKINDGLEEPTYDMIHKHFICSDTKPQHPTLKFNKWNKITKEYKTSYLRLRHLPPSICFQTDYPGTRPFSEDSPYAAYIYRPRVTNAEPNVGYNGAYHGNDLVNHAYIRKKEVMEVRMYRGVHNTHLPPTGDDLLVFKNEITFKDKNLDGMALLVDCDYKVNHLHVEDEMVSSPEYNTFNNVLKQRIPVFYVSTVRDVAEYAFDLFYNRYTSKEFYSNIYNSDFDNATNNGTRDIDRVKMTPNISIDTLTNTVDEPNKVGEVWNNYMRLHGDFYFRRGRNGSDIPANGHYFSDCLINRLFPYINPNDSQLATLYVRIGAVEDTLPSEWVRLPIYKSKKKNDIDT